jgi:predicted nucleotidyltransferase
MPDTIIRGTSEKGTSLQQAIVQWAAGEPSIRRVWLFGARSATTPRPGSRVDVAVELAPVPDSEETLGVWFANFERWRAQLEKRITPGVDLEWFDPDALEMGRPRTKTLVYERTA